MVTELDHTAIIDRIIEIFQADANLYTATGTKIRKFLNGVPTEPPTAYPYVYVAFENEADQPFEAVTVGGAPSLMSQTSSYHKWNYIIVIVTNLQRNENSEQSFLNWIKLIKERLKSNVQLANPTTGADAKVKLSHPVRTSTKRGISKTDGTAIAAAIITLACEQVTI